MTKIKQKKLSADQKFYKHSAIYIKYQIFIVLKFLKNILKKENIDSIEIYTIGYLFLDDKLLEHFEEMGYYEKQGIISIDFIYEFFDWDIETIWENPEIQKYITYIKNNSDIKIIIYSLSL